MALDVRNGDLYNAWKPVGYHAMQLPFALNPPSSEQAAKLTEVLHIMAEVFLGRGEAFIGGNMMSIADYSIVALINTLTSGTVAKMGFRLPASWDTWFGNVKGAL